MGVWDFLCSADVLEFLKTKAWQIVVFLSAIFVSSFFLCWMGATDCSCVSPEYEEAFLTMKRLTKDQWAEELVTETDKWVMDEINTANLEANLKFFSAEPHLAGTPRDNYLAHYIKDKFLEYGFDWAEKTPYKLLLTRPLKAVPNKIRIFKENSTADNFASRHAEDTLDALDPNYVDSFLAFTPAGAFVSPRKGEGIVYVNYGLQSDFNRLKAMGLSVEGRIAMMRYGKMHRGQKIKNAENMGAQGVILFSDPEHVALEGQAPEDVYPYSWWLPGTGMQRGSAFLDGGDPLTPGWPSTEFAHRIPRHKAGFPKIPAQAIGYDDARLIFERMGGNDAPVDWQGGLNVTYKLGPELRSEYADYTVSLNTFNFDEEYLSYNVFGSIVGHAEPDRYVLIGNHRDAWGKGAVDPSSGTAQLLETARVLGKLVKEKGWRPRRTLVFCSWGAEEYGLIGSREWVEEHVDKLQGRSVSYINTDLCTSGPMLQMSSSPQLYDMISSILKRVPGVQDPETTIFDEMVDYQMTSNRYKPNDDFPKYTSLSGASDFAHFFMYAGIPSLDMAFKHDTREHDVFLYPAYHTGFDTFDLVEKFIDPDFKITQGCGRVASLTAMCLADSLMLPFNLTRFATVMVESLEMFASGVPSLRSKIVTFYPRYASLEKAASNLTAATKSFHESVQNKAFNPIQMRQINDQLIKFEQAFLLPQGLPGRPMARHAVLSPSQRRVYKASAFPGIVDLMADYDRLTGEDRAQREEQLRQHVSLLTIMTNRAAGLLTDVHKFEPYFTLAKDRFNSYY